MSVIYYAVNSTKKQEYELGKNYFFDPDSLTNKNEDELVEILTNFRIPLPVATNVAKEIYGMGIEFVSNDDFFDTRRDGCRCIGSIWDYDWKTGVKRY